MPSPSRLKPGSIASEAARLTVELDFPVTPDMVRWWRKKEYPLDDPIALLQRIRNQQRLPEAQKVVDPDDGSWPMTLAYTYLSDAVISGVQGTVPVADVLRYLRDHWEAYELQGDTTLLDFRQRSVKYDMLQLRDLLDIDVVEQHRGRLCGEVFSFRTKKF